MKRSPGEKIIQKAALVPVRIPRRTARALDLSEAALALDTLLGGSYQGRGMGAILRLDRITTFPVSDSLDALLEGKDPETHVPVLERSVSLLEDYFREAREDPLLMAIPPLSEQEARKHMERSGAPRVKKTEADKEYIVGTDALQFVMMVRRAIRDLDSEHPLYHISAFLDLAKQAYAFSDAGGQAFCQHLGEECVRKLPFQERMSVSDRAIAFRERFMEMLSEAEACLPAYASVRSKAERAIIEAVRGEAPGYEAVARAAPAIDSLVREGADMRGVLRFIREFEGERRQDALELIAIEPEMIAVYAQVKRRGSGAARVLRLFEEGTMLYEGMSLTEAVRGLRGAPGNLDAWLVAKGSSIAGDPHAEELLGIGQGYAIPRAVLDEYASARERGDGERAERIFRVIAERPDAVRMKALRRRDYQEGQTAAAEVRHPSRRKDWLHHHLPESGLMNGDEEVLRSAHAALGPECRHHLHSALERGVTTAVRLARDVNEFGGEALRPVLGNPVLSSAYLERLGGGFRGGERQAFVGALTSGNPYKELRRVLR